MADPKIQPGRRIPRKSLEIHVGISCYFANHMEYSSSKKIIETGHYLNPAVGMARESDYLGAKRTRTRRSLWFQGSRTIPAILRDWHDDFARSAVSRQELHR